jgi:hypothetical protein
MAAVRAATMQIKIQPKICGGTLPFEATSMEINPKGSAKRV